MHRELIERIRKRADRVTPAPDNGGVDIVLTLRGCEAVAALRWLERQEVKHAKNEQDSDFGIIEGELNYRESSVKISGGNINARDIVGGDVIHQSALITR